MNKQIKLLFRRNAGSGVLKLCLIIVISLMSAIGLSAQTGREVTGTISSVGEPLIGASVVEKGTTNGTMADLDGKFTLRVGNNASLEVTYLGFKTKIVPVGGQSILNIEMEENSNVLNEVVAIGYGVQKKKLNTGATLQIKGDDLERKSTTSPLQALQGQTPGVQITSMSGQPGDGFKVLVRGVGTTGNSAPLYIVDGIQTSDITHINNADIESIDVLKDAASAAIYGSQAANGVVLITTKTGRKGKNQLSFDAYYGIQNAARKVNLLNAREYATIMNEANVNSGGSMYFTQNQINAMGKGTSWMDEMIADNVPTQSYTISAQGGSDASVYSTSLGYTSQGGIVGGKKFSNYERFSFRVNTEHKFLNNKAKFGQHLTFTYIKKNGIQTGNMYNNSLRSAFNVSPFLPMYDDSGNYVNTNYVADKEDAPIVNGVPWQVWDTSESNPYATMAYSNQNRDNNQKLIGDVYLEIEPVEKLKIRTTAGLDYFSNEGRSYTPIYKLSRYAFNSRDKVFQSMSKGRAWNWDNMISYSINVNSEHQFDAMLGTSARRYSGSWINGSNADLSIKGLKSAWLSNAENTDISFISLNGGPDVKEMLLSYFGRLNYNWKETYMANITFRADGSSKFAENNRWGYYPSVSLGWIITNEPWMAKTTDWLDYLKVRGSWGQVGSQNIGNHKYLALISTSNGEYVFGNKTDASANVPGTYPLTLANSNLKWETSEQLNFGLDAIFLNGKINANIDWYNKKTKDWLIEVPVLSTSGVATRLINGGDVTNTGIEVGLAYNDKIGSDFRYTVSGNVTYNKNKVGKIPTNDQIIHGKGNLYDGSPEFYRASNGEPIGYFWGWKTNGVFQNQSEVDSYVDKNGNKIQPNAEAGDMRYKDINGDGIINDDDKTNIGNPNPDVTMGLTFSCNYKNFDFSVSTHGVFGNQLVQSYRDQTGMYSNYTTAILDRWHGEGSSNKIPRVTNSNTNWQFSELYIQDGDFLKISNITLGYDFSKIIKSNLISQLRLYGSVQNAFTFTKYDGMDPEVGFGSDSFSSGVDLGYYPNARTILFGVNVKF